MAENARADLLRAAIDAWSAPDHVPDLDALARAVGVYPVSRIALLSLEEGFPEKDPETGYSTRAVREWLETRKPA